MSSDPLQRLSSLTVVEAIFDQPSFSDLTLVVADRPFHCLRSVLAPVSRFVQNAIDWKTANRLDSPLTVTIDMPEIRFPQGCAPKPNPIFWFECYLKLVYGLYKPENDDLTELFVIVQIADYMISPDVIEVCDHLLSSRDLCSEEQLYHLPILLQYSLPRSITAFKRNIAENLFTLRILPELYELDLQTFGEILRLQPDDPWTVWILLGYLSGMVPEDSDFPSNVFHIKTPEHVQFFRDMVQDLSASWGEETLENLFRDLENDTIYLQTEKLGKELLYKAIAKAYRKIAINDDEL